MGTVLVVDDELPVRELFKAWLEEAGYTVRVADSGIAAREALLAAPADVVLTDIRMAQGTGMDLLAWVRHYDPELPVVLITAVPTMSTAIEALRLDAYDYLVKPVEEAELLRAIGRAAQYRSLLQEKRHLEEDNRRYQQHLEELVAQRTAELQEALEVRDKMLSNVSHELRTPLTIIRGYAELLVENLLAPIGEEVRQAAAIILRQAAHLQYLVDLLLAFQRLEHEAIPVEEVPVGAWLDQVAATWRPILASAGLQLRTEIAPDLGDVQGNYEYLQQVMNNLLDNARKFSPNGGQVTLRAWREGGEVCVSVADQGIGIAPEKLPRIFERFYQAEESLTRRFGGMGLGLSLCREIVHRLGGRIWAESPGEGKGMTVTFTLPALSSDTAGQR